MLPSVIITKADGQTGVVRPSADGVLAIIAPSEKGTANQAAGYTSATAAITDFGYGALTGYAAIVLSMTQRPVVLVKSTSTTAGTYGTVTSTDAGTSTITAGNTTPLDDYVAKLLIVAGGTIGVAGATYQTSLDNGQTWSAVTALGTATSVSIANSGVKFALGAGTLLAGQVSTVVCTGPRTSLSDRATALEALRVAGVNWESVLIHGETVALDIAQIDTWLKALQSKGRYKTAVCGLRVKNSGETEADYLTAMQTIVSGSSSLDIVVSADAGNILDPVQNIVFARQAAVFVAARGMSVDISEDVAYVARGPLPNVSIVDTRGNPLHHDEAIYPGLDDLRLATLRSFPGKQGTYITNAPLLSPAMSDYVYWQHARLINKAAEIAYATLTEQLSTGVNKSTTVGANGERYISEDSAQLIEGLVNAALSKALKGRVSDVVFQLSRTDDISSNAGATVTGRVSSVALAYVKEFNVSVGFVKAIPAGAA